MVVAEQVQPAVQDQYVQLLRQTVPLASRVSFRRIDADDDVPQGVCSSVTLECEHVRCDILSTVCAVEPA